MSTNKILIDALRDYDPEKAREIVALYDSEWRFAFTSNGGELEESDLYRVSGHLTEQEAIDDCLSRIWDGIIVDRDFYEGRPFRVRVWNEDSGFDKEMRVVFSETADPDVTLPDEPERPGF